MGSGRGRRRTPWHAAAHQAGVTVEGRLQRAGGVCLRAPALAAAVLARALGLAVGGVIDMDKELLVVKALKIREKGETPPNTQGLKPPKAQGWWESSTRGDPRRPRKQHGAMGRGGEPREGLPALADGCQAASWLPSLFLGCSSAGSRGGIGCKQAPEYCLMEPAKA